MGISGTEKKKVGFTTNGPATIMTGSSEGETKNEVCAERSKMTQKAPPGAQGGGGGGGGVLKAMGRESRRCPKR